MGPGSNSDNVRGLSRSRHYRFIRGDLSDYKTTRRTLKDADYVVNFAAETHVDRSIANPLPFLRSNVVGVYNLLQAARESGIRRFVHISTDEVYGSIESGSFSEESLLSPSSPYSATKAAGDQLVKAWSATYKVPAIILRCTNNFGPNQHPEKFIPKTIIRAIRNMEIPLYGGGGQVRDWIYVEDFCSGVEKALEKGSPGETYNFSAGNELTNRDVAERLVKHLESVSKIVEVEDRPAHDFRYSLSSEKARHNLSWRPAHSFDEALSLTVKWYLKNQSWWKPIATSKVLSPAPWAERW
jgi:dTDP-glucose 4,6-dehydratase